jgi:hypothetical protein
MGLSQALQQPFCVVLTPWRLMSAWRLPSIESNWFCFPLAPAGGTTDVVNCWDWRCAEGCGLGELFVALFGFAYGESVTVWCWWVLALIYNKEHNQIQNKNYHVMRMKCKTFPHTFKFNRWLLD